MLHLFKCTSSFSSMAKLIKCLQQTNVACKDAGKKKLRGSRYWAANIGTSCKCMMLFKLLGSEMTLLFTLVLTRAWMHWSYITFHVCEQSPYITVTWMWLGDIPTRTGQYHWFINCRLKYCRIAFHTLVKYIQKRFFMVWCVEIECR